MDAITKIAAVSLETVQDYGQYEAPVAFDIESSEGLGAQFLDALGETKAQISETSNAISETLAIGDSVTPVELLKVQYELFQVTLQQELISKGVTKSTQNVDTLIKAQ